MLKQVLIILALSTSVASFAAEDCSTIARSYALDSLGKIMLDDWLHEKKMVDKELKVDVAKARLRTLSKSIKGVTQAYSVPIKIRAGEELWSFEKVFMFGPACIRNLRAEATQTEK